MRRFFTFGDADVLFFHQANLSQLSTIKIYLQYVPTTCDLVQNGSLFAVIRQIKTLHRFLLKCPSHLAVFIIAELGASKSPYIKQQHTE